MKKLVLTAAIVFELSMVSFADPNGGGLFQRGAVNEETNYSNRNGAMTPGLPIHGQEGNQDAPLSGGAAALIGLGIAYALGKRQKKE